MIPQFTILHDPNYNIDFKYIEDDKGSNILDINDMRMIHLFQPFLYFNETCHFCCYSLFSFHFTPKSFSSYIII